MMRLDRFLCETGFGTRSQVKELLKKGLVTVNGEPVKKPEQKVKETQDVVLCGGKRAVYAAFLYLMLHKAAGGGAFGSRPQIQQLLSGHGRGPGGCRGGKGLQLPPPAPEQAL